MMNLTRLSCMGEALRDAMIPFKSNVALIEADRDREEGRWTYRELTVEAERLGALLQDDGFDAGDRCAILMANQSKWIFSGLGALWAGGTLVPLDYKLKNDEQLGLLAHAKPRVLITEWPIWRKLKDDPEKVLANVRVLVTEAPDDADLGAGQRWETSPSASFTLVQRAREDVACIVYSSGTGGTPKGCQLTHANYLCQAEQLARLFPMNEDDRYFSILPTNHAIDFMCGFLIPLLMGGAIVHQRTLRPQFLRSTMKRYGITHIAVVPMILKAFERAIREKLDELEGWKRSMWDGLVSLNTLATQRKPNQPLSRLVLRQVHDSFGGRLRYIFCGGAFTDRSTAEFFYELGLPVVIGYGLTEAGTVLTLNDLKPFRGDTVGKPIDGVELELRDVNDENIGEVWVRSNTIMKGYLDEPELTDEAIVDGWLKTGDLGSVDASGHLKLMGRAKNMIVTEGGKNIYPEDIESTFDALNGSEEHCVFAANYVWPTGKLTDESLMIVLRPTNGDLDSVVGQIREMNRGLVDFKRLTSYVVWSDEFPRTASMKVKRQVLATQLAEQMSREDALMGL